MERRLTAILAADVVGYSRLMGANEVGTLQSLQKHQAELIHPEITDRKGRVVKLTGDPLASGNPVVRRALPNAESFVADSRASEASSDQEGNTAVGGVPVYKTTMSFAFEPGSVDALVAGAGLKVWGGPRPRPILWLAIDDGRGARLVNSQQLNVVSPLAKRGLERGLRFGMPAGSNPRASRKSTATPLRRAPSVTVTWVSTICGEHVTYATTPPGRAARNPAASSSRCNRVSGGRSEGLRRHRDSGRRRNEPRPVHGASISTRSKDPAGRRGSRPTVRPSADRTVTGNPPVACSTSRAR